MDFIPVIFFAIGAVLLQRLLYDAMSKGAFALFAAGTIDIICAGGLKALYKLLYAAGVCDFERLNQMFFPVQSIGFLLAGIGVLALLTHPQGNQTDKYRGKDGKLYGAAAPAVFSGTMIFVLMMVLGSALMNIGLAIMAFKKKKTLVGVLFILAFLFSMCMGYLSSRDFTQASMNWIAEGVNVVGQACFLLGAVNMKKAFATD